MQIPFRRITTDPHPFDLERGGLKIEGNLRKYRSGLVLLEARMRGKLGVECYLCGESFAIMPDENVAFLISDGVFHGQDENYDVVEMHEGVIDLDEIFDSEIAMIESDYHACDACK